MSHRVSEKERKRERDKMRLKNLLLFKYLDDDINSHCTILMSNKNAAADRNQKKKFDEERKMKRNIKKATITTPKYIK